MDHYDTIIVQRGDAAAVRLLADDCRKKDFAILKLTRDLKRFEKPCAVCQTPCLPDGPDDTRPICSGTCELLWERMQEADREGDERFHAVVDRKVAR